MNKKLFIFLIMIAASINSKTAMAQQTEEQPMRIKEPVIAVCSNQKVVYEATDRPGFIYDWKIEPEANGRKVDATGNKVTVTWETVPIASIIQIKVTARNPIITESDSTFVAISSDVVPDENPTGIVEKKEEDKDGYRHTYILIYPDPGYNYQWYKGLNADTKLVDGDKQFYYPPQGKFDGKDFSVKVWKNNENCACMAKITIADPIPPAPENPVSVFPNPVSSGSFTVSFNREALKDNNPNYVLSIYSSLGMKVWEQKIITLDNITVSKTMPTGLYFITLSTGKQQYTEKFSVK